MIRRSALRASFAGLAAGALLLTGCSAPTDGTSAAPDASAGTTTAPSSPAVARGDLQVPVAFSSGTSCKHSDAKYTACVYYSSSILRFTRPGTDADSGFTIASYDQTEDHGEIYDNHGPVSPLGTNTPVWASYESNGAGIEGHAKYRVQEDPYRTSDDVGYYFDMPAVGTNGGNCIDSAYLFCHMDLPGSKDWNAEYRVHFWNRPLAVQIHNNVPGMTLVKQGRERVSGMLAEPAATNQPDADSRLVADGTTVDGTTSRGRAFFGGYRSGQDDASFAVDYEVTDPADTAHVGSTFAIHVQVDRGNPNNALPATRCDVSGQQATVRLQCRITVSGDNNGQSLATVEISKN